MQNEKTGDQPEPACENPRQRSSTSDSTNQEWFLTWLRLARRADQNPSESKNN